jgi:hypothetical protein
MPADVPTSLEVAGTCSCTSWHPTGDRNKSLPFKFRLRLRDGAWSMRIDDLDVYAGKRRSYDYQEIMFDGTDLFRAAHYPDAVRTNSNVKSASETFGNVRSVRGNSFPGFAQLLEKALWVTFCRGEYPPLTPMNFPPISVSLVADNITAVNADYFPAPPHVLKSIKVWAKGRYSLPDKVNPKGIIAPATAPFQDGYLALDLESTSPTNIDGTVLVPRHIVASAYSLDSSTPAKRYLETQVVFSVETISTNVESIAPPQLIGKANIRDTRYINTRDNNHVGRSFHYLETNGSWVSRTEPNNIKVLESKATVPISKRPSAKKTNRHAWIVLVVALAPIPFFVSAFFRKRRENTQTTQTTKTTPST